MNAVGSRSPSSKKNFFDNLSIFKAWFVRLAPAILGTTISKDAFHCLISTSCTPLHASCSVSDWGVVQPRGKGEKDEAEGCSGKQPQPSLCPPQPFATDCSKFSKLVIPS